MIPAYRYLGFDFFVFKSSCLVLPFSFVFLSGVAVGWYKLLQQLGFGFV